MERMGKVAALLSMIVAGCAPWPRSFSQKVFVAEVLYVSGGEGPTMSKISIFEDGSLRLVEGGSPPFWGRGQGKELTKLLDILKSHSFREILEEHGRERVFAYDCEAILIRFHDFGKNDWAVNDPRVYSFCIDRELLPPPLKEFVEVLGKVLKKAFGNIWGSNDPGEEREVEEW